MPTLASMISALFILLLSAVAVAVGVGYVRKASAMRGFVSTRGTVIEREVVAMSGDTGEPSFGQGGGYTQKVTYRFTAGGGEHTSDKLGYATRGYKREVAARRLAEILTRWRSGSIRRTRQMPISSVALRESVG